MYMLIFCESGFSMKCICECWPIAELQQDSEMRINRIPITSD